jgi:hypothetical protein
LAAVGSGDSPGAARPAALLNVGRAPAADHGLSGVIR